MAIHERNGQLLALTGLDSAHGAVPDLTHLRDLKMPALVTPHAGTKPSTVKLDLQAGAMLPQVQIYEDIDFGGANAITSLNWYYVGDFWNDRISSIVVVSGVWRFYIDWHYEGAYWDLGPGYYHWIVEQGIPNDSISSFQVIGA